MTIGIDLDDTLLETSKCINKIMQSIPEYKNVKDFYNLTDEEINEFLKKYLLEFEKIELKEKSLEVLNYFIKEGLKIVFITARGDNGNEFLIELTNRYLKNNKIPYDEIVYQQSRKGTMCKEKRVDIFIDDLEHVLDEVKEKGIKTLRFSEKNVVSNHDVVHNWKEVKDYINRIRGELNG